MRYLAQVHVLLKESVLDPQGQAVLHALHSMSFPEVDDVRVGKLIEVRLHADSKSQAEQKVQAYCTSLLANPVIESFTFEVGEAK